MRKVSFVATTNWDPVNNLGLKILDRMLPASEEVKLGYLDLSNLWDPYFPKDALAVGIKASRMSNLKRTVRLGIDNVKLRTRLFRAGISYASVGKTAIEKAIKRQYLKTKSYSYSQILNIELFGQTLQNILFHDAALFLKMHDFHAVDHEIKLKIRDMAIVILALNDLLCESKYLDDAGQLFALEGYSFNILLKLASQARARDLVFFTAASHMNVSFDMVEFTSDTLPSRRRRKSLYWEQYRDQLSLDERLLSESLSDIETRLLRGGSHIFSPPLIKEHFAFSPHVELGIDEKLPIVSVFTSSLDEFVATQSLQAVFSQKLPTDQQVFKDQIDMLKSLVSIANSRKNFCLVVRHHPRLGAAKGQSQSQFYDEICGALGDIQSPYVRVILPERKLSSYWLIAWSDCVLNSWSNIGLESLRLGVPTLNMFSEHLSVCYWPQILFPPCDSVSAIDNFIQESIDCRSPTEAHRAQFRMAHKFYCFMNVSSFIQVVPEHEAVNGPDLHEDEFLHAILQPNDWESESFDSLKGASSRIGTEMISADFIAGRLIDLFQKQCEIDKIDTLQCPLVLRLTKYSQPI